jgi:enoyl-[acyl-carrier protein] reductase III
VSGRPREVLVTGGGRGLGRAIALRFAGEGARLFLGCFAHRADAEKTALDVEARGGRAEVLQADLKDPAQVRALFAEIRRLAGRLDVFVSNAASGVFRDLLALSARQWDWVMATSARATLLAAQEAAALMEPGGAIVTVSSLGSARVVPGYGALGVSKAALEALTRYLAVELAPRGITVNAVSAGALETDVWQALPGGERLLDAARARTPGGALVSLEAVADVVAFLAGPGARGLRGQVLVVDGGYSLLA